MGSEEDIIFIQIGCDCRMGRRQESKGTGALGTEERKENKTERRQSHIFRSQQVGKVS